MKIILASATLRGRLFILLFLIPLESKCQEISLTPKEWIEDLDYLENQMILTHVNAFHSIDQQTFHKNKELLKSRIPNMDKEEILVEMARMVSSIKDGHTRLWLIPNKQNGFRFYPFITYLFEDGLYIIATDKDNQEILGGKIIRINSVPVDSIAKIIYPLIPQDNEWQAMATFPIYVTIPQILKGTGIIEDVNKPMIEVQIGNRTITYNPHPVDPILPIWKDLFWALEYRRKVFKNGPLVYARDTLSTPAYLIQKTPMGLV